jgi:hypothetical protein
MPEQDTDLLEILICEVGQDTQVNAILGEALGVLGHAELSSHCSISCITAPRPGELMLLDAPDGQFYPIDRLA